MCRNIRRLFNYDPPTIKGEVEAASLQFVRKISGYRQPSSQNESAFNHAVEQVSEAACELLDSLMTSAPPRNREAEIAAVRLKYAQRGRG